MDRRMKILRGAAKARQALDLHATPPREVPMNTAQSIRAFAALTALGLVAGPATQASRRFPTLLRVKQWSAATLSLPCRASESKPVRNRRCPSSGSPRRAAVVMGILADAPGRPTPHQ